MINLFLIIFAAVALIAILWVEDAYSPRIDITKEGDVLLWYSTPGGFRKYRFLFKF